MRLRVEARGRFFSVRLDRMASVFLWCRMRICPNRVDLMMRPVVLCCLLVPMSLACSKKHAPTSTTSTTSKTSTTSTSTTSTTSTTSMAVASAPTPKEASSAMTLSGAIDIPAAAASIAPVTTGAPKPRPLAGKKILHVGDSMVGGNYGLTRSLEGKLAEEGAKIVRHTTVSESLNSFDKGPTLKDLIRTHDPDIVIINLGANDELSPYPQTYAHSVSNITKRVGDRECWWIGPPSWKGPDTGLVKVIADNVGKCHFFDSTKLDLERASDGIHPNDRGAAKWADAFWKVFREAEN